MSDKLAVSGAILVNRITGVRTRVDVLAPARTEAGCVFLKEGRCSIHENKPAECAAVDHVTTRDQGDLIRASILEEWRVLRA